MGTENASEREKRKRYVERFGALRAERSSWLDHWRDLSDQIDPRRSRFVVSDANKGQRRNQKIYNNTPIRAKATLAAGMQSGLTSPARPWFRCVAPTPELAEVASVKEWLHAVELQLREMCARSNVYNAFHLVYGDLAGFGTAAMYIEEDVESVIRCQVFPIGSYCLFLDATGRVCGIFREVTMTVGQLVEMFGMEACSQSVKGMHEKGQLDDRIEVTHVIERNKKVQKGKLGAAGKGWVSCWFETTSQDAGMLRESGFDEFPVMAPRWLVTGEDTYGSSPGMEALGDCRALQLYEKRSAQAFDKVVNPPMKAPSALNGQRISLLPGDTTYTDSMSAGATFSPAHEISPQALPAFAAKIAETERHINQAFYADLWLQLSQSDGVMTAREVSERREEKMLQLGPVTERTQNELLDPSLSRIFAIGFRRGMFPPPPLELQGQEMKIEFVSMLSQAQKVVGTTALERLASFAGGLFAVKADIIDVVDFDQVVQEYADMLGVAPAVIRTDEAIARIRAAVAEAQQAAQEAEQLTVATQAGKTMSETKLDEGSALDAMLPQMGFAGR